MAPLDTGRNERSGDLLRRTEIRRLRAGDLNKRQDRSALGQFLTPPAVAQFLASCFEIPTGPSRLLDPGAGVGSLTAAVVDRFVSVGAPPLDVTAVEVDEKLTHLLTATLEDATASAEGTTFSIVIDDFITWGSDRCGGFESVFAEPFDLVVMNPPYRKINTGSAERLRLRAAGIEVSNIYAGFLALAARLLAPNGQLVAITPRSFANGPYFRSFRSDFFSRMALRRIHVYETRDSAFSGDDVLQENVVFLAVKDGERRPVTVTTSSGPSDADMTIREVPYDLVIRPDDPDKFIHLETDDSASAIGLAMRSLPANLATVGCEVSTGRVVDFRTRENLRSDPGENTAPLVYPTHFDGGSVRWPIIGGRKPNAIAVNESTAKLLLPNGNYVLVRRFSAKEERRRVVAVVADPDHLPGPFVAFENHVNVYHERNEGLEADLARGLACFLNSSIVDLFVRQFSGHTQVNATDLRSLPYPTRGQLRELGAAAGSGDLSQEKIDSLVAEHVPALLPKSGGDPVALHKRVQEAQEVLRALGLPRPQTNERSALTLLALLDLPPDKAWPDAARPMLGIARMMDFMADRYGKRYAPNTREAVRRQTVHQFVAAGLAVINPDDPTRPTNSGQTVYQVPEPFLEVARSFGSDAWDEQLARWTKVSPSLAKRWAEVRDQNMIPVTLPSGEAVTLSPGGQNPLIKSVIEDFCPRFAPGGHVLYIGDTGDKFVVWARDRLEALGISINEKGKMPDVVVLDHERGWLLLVEAVTSHGPIDPKRHEELAALFGDADAGLVFVTAFADRRTLADYLGVLSWETEVWIAEDPSHMVHFDGSRFLGPYEG